MRYIVVLLSFLWSYEIYPQTQISILTCSQGQEIYSTFGHSAIRVRDSFRGEDIVYNYGLFDFYDPKFIPKFVHGYLDYSIGAEEASRFFELYASDHRNVMEQVLNVTPEQAKKIQDFLQWNLKPENKEYRYNFLLENCATKIIDILVNQADMTQLSFQGSMQNTYRGLINAYSVNLPWLNWGMDLLLGESCDTSISKRAFCFLPDYVMRTLKATPNLVKSTIYYDNTPIIPNQSFLGPWLIWILIIAMMVSFYVPLRIGNLYRKMIYLVFFIASLIIAYAWFFTEHSVTKNNLNLLWLSPLYLVFFLREDIYRLHVFQSGLLAILCIVLVLTHFELHYVSWISIVLLMIFHVQSAYFLKIKKSVI
ncbi:MAG: DUF4105 domain-containing protein [Chitinophagales bacterium]|jgi:hypothetical protein|nr:DUF4105 domain-containing protein [Chitinophagales bacterium]